MFDKTASDHILCTLPTPNFFIQDDSSEV